MGLMSTRTTLEFRLALAVGLLAVAALGTRPGTVAGVDPLEHHPGQRCLVLDERPKLKERPTAHSRSLRPAKPSPVADALEVFKADPASGVFGLRNKLLADLVVYVSPIPRFPLLGPRHRLVAVPPLAPSGSPGRLAQRSPPRVAYRTRLASIFSEVCFSPSPSTAMLITPRSTPKNSVAGVLVPAATSTVTSRNHLPSSRKYQVGLPLGVQVNFSAWYFPMTNATSTRPFKVEQAQAIGSLERHPPHAERHRRRACGISVGCSCPACMPHRLGRCTEPPSRPTVRIAPGVRHRRVSGEPACCCTGGRTPHRRASWRLR